MNHRLRFLRFTLFLLGFSVAIPNSLLAQVRKSCATGITLKLSAGVTPQGSLILVDILGTKPPPDLTAEWDGKPAPLWKEGAATKTLHGLLGVDLEKPPGKYDWKVSWTGPGGNAMTCSATVTVHKGQFRTESLKVDNQFVQPDAQQQKRAEEDQKKMKAIYDTVTPQRLWEGKFRLPLKDVTTGGNFGRRRILNGQPRSPHAGVDFPAASGTPVFASQSGKVMLAEDLYYSGNTVVIDHGYGIYTMYCHLSEIGVKPGQDVAVSSEIGKVGATGRVTGPHLHWGLTIEHARVNGMDIVQRMP